MKRFVCFGFFCICFMFCGSLFAQEKTTDTKSLDQSINDRVVTASSYEPEESTTTKKVSEGSAEMKLEPVESVEEPTLSEGKSEGKKEEGNKAKEQKENEDKDTKVPSQENVQVSK